MDAERRRAIADQLAELQLCFPSVAPRLTMNLELDRNAYFGFDTPSLALLAKYQVPMLLEAYERIGAFTKDSSRKSGYRTVIQHRFSNGASLTNAQLAKYFGDYANIVSEKIAEGQPYKMAAFSVALTPEVFEKVYATIAPILKEISQESPKEGSYPARIVFGTVLEKK